MKDYLKLPLRFGQFFEQRRLPVCSIRESISGNLHLLIMTALEENKQNLEYGSQFWDQEFDIHLSADMRRETILATLRKQIAAFEKRLGKVSIEVRVRQPEVISVAGTQIRRRIEVIIRGVVVRSNEPFSFQTGFYIGPLALD